MQLVSVLKIWEDTLTVIDETTPLNYGNIGTTNVKEL